MHVTGETQVGGLVGGGSGAAFEDSVFDGIVTGDACVGGAVGRGDGWSPDGARPITVRRIASRGEVIGNDSVGGVVGCLLNEERISGSRSSASVVGVSRVGGIVGVSTGSSVQDSYFDGSVTGETRTGGIVGESFSSVARVWIGGSVSGSGSYRGSVAGYVSAGSISATFYDTAIGLPAAGDGPITATGLTAAQMRIQVSYGGALDFTTVWAIDEGVDFPRLRWE